MEPKTVRQLEHRIEDAIARMMARMEPDELPLLPSQRTMHLMAKAAVAVFESAEENQSAEPPTT